MALIICSGICGSRARGYLPGLLLDREIGIAILDVAKLAAHKLCARLAFLRTAIRHAGVYDFYMFTGGAGQMIVGG